MIILNDNKSKIKKSAFVLNDIIKRKILEMYKTSKIKSIKKKTASKNKKTPNTINKSELNSNTK